MSDSLHTRSEPVQVTTICFPIRQRRGQVLLGMKKIGFGKGKWNGFGGKVNLDEHLPVVAAVRELQEESGLVAQLIDLIQVAQINFFFAEKAICECHIFLTHRWRGTPVETEEMRPQWFPLSALPFEAMWAADARWIPLILTGQRIKGTIVYDADGKVVKDFKYMSL